MTSKTCSHPDCGLTKPLTDFPKKGNRCKACMAQKSKLWRSLHPRDPQKTAQYHAAAKVKLEQMKSEDPAKYALIKAKHIQAVLKWQAANPEKVKLTSTPAKARYRKKLYNSDPQFNMRMRLSSRLTELLKKASTTKNMTTRELTGCTSQELCSHLEAQFHDGMTWENRKFWDVDHWIPCANFDLTDPEEQKKCFNFMNLQPMWRPDNNEKRNSVSLEDLTLFAVQWLFR